MTKEATPGVPRIQVGSDHAAIAVRGAVARHLRARGFEVDEVGPADGESVDYPLLAERVARAVADGQVNLGVLACGTGIGVSIVANKVPGIRAALVHDPYTARMAAMHNRANVLCLGGRLMAPEYAVELVDAWLDTPFEERHQRRLDLISAMERDESGRRE